MIYKVLFNKLQRRILCGPSAYHMIFCRKDSLQNNPLIEGIGWNWPMVRLGACFRTAIWDIWITGRRQDLNPQSKKERHLSVWSSSPLHWPTSSISPEDLYISNDFDCSRGWLASIVEHTYSIDCCCCCCSWWLSVGKFGPLEALGKLWIDQRTTKLINAPVDYTTLVSSASSVASLGWVGWAELSAQSKTPLFLIKVIFI